MRKVSVALAAFVCRSNLALTSDAELQMAQAQVASGSQAMPHMDHQAKHHGIFMMAPDNIHHIEGVLLPSSNFNLYLYDEYTKPLSADRIRKVTAYVTLPGDSASAARKVKLTISGTLLQASLGKDLKLPAVLKLHHSLWRSAFSEPSRGILISL